MRSHPWSSGVENEVDIMPVSRDQYNTRKTTIDKHFLRRRLVDKRKEEWKKMLNKEDDVPKSIDYRANVKNSVKREVVAETAQRLSDNSHAAIREMRAARLSARVTAPSMEAKSQSAREMRLARLKQNTTIDSSPSLLKHKSLKKAVRVERAAPEPKDHDQVTSSIREMRVAQGKSPVAKSYTSTTPVLRVPKASPTKPVKSVRPEKTVPIRKTLPKPVQLKDKDDDAGGGCNFVNRNDLVGGCNKFGKTNNNAGCHKVPTVDDLKGGCNAADYKPEDVGCDFSLLKDFASFFDCGHDSAPGAELVSGGSSEDSASVYIKKYGYDF